MIVRTRFFLAIGTLSGLLFAVMNRQLAWLKRTHEELVNAHKELKKTQLQIIHAAKLESVGRLAAGIAHEVKNPLATVQLGIYHISGKVKGNDDTAEVVADMDNAGRLFHGIVGRGQRKQAQKGVKMERLPVVRQGRWKRNSTEEVWRCK